MRGKDPRDEVVERIRRKRWALLCVNRAGSLLSELGESKGSASGLGLGEEVDDAEIKLGQPPQPRCSGGLRPHLAAGGGLPLGELALF